MKIALLVQGRFHAFELGRALRLRGNEVVLHTNYPPWLVRRWDPDAVVAPFPLHLFLARAGEVIAPIRTEPIVHSMFGRWGARRLSDKGFDVLHCWSGVAEETMRSSATEASTRLLMRGSAHIRSQKDLLEQEKERTGLEMRLPSDWMVAREEREYQLADKIVVLSTFARTSFLDQGVPEGKIRLLPLGARLSRFSADDQTLQGRCSRITSGRPLRVLYVGNVSARKGIRDIGVTARHLAGRMEFRCVGGVEAGVRALSRSLKTWIDFTGKLDESSLPDQYAWGDIFLFPTIEDGFGVVLAQAQAAGLPIIATSNCSAPDFVVPGKTGWIVPIRDTDAIEARLEWCDQNRDEVAGMVRSAAGNARTRSWDDVARDFETLCQSSAK